VKAASIVAALATGAAACALGQPARSARELAPVDLTGAWTSVVTEDWAWRMHTPPKGDYASVPLNDAGKRLADTWTEAQAGSCQAFGAAALLRNPTRLRIAWRGDDTLELQTDNGMQTRALRFGEGETALPATHTLQGRSHAEWQIAALPRPRGAGNPPRDEPPAPLKVTTTSLSAAWLRGNGVPVSDAAVLTEYFDWFRDGDDEWLVVTTIVDDPAYLTERFIVSSNFRKERSGAKWSPRPCKS